MFFVCLVVPILFGIEKYRHKPGILTAIGMGGLCIFGMIIGYGITLLSVIKMEGSGYLEFMYLPICIIGTYFLIKKQWLKAFLYTKFLEILIMFGHNFFR